jgi:arsenate reductase
MPNKAIIYHNPRCSKSRATLQLLRENNIEPKIIEYLIDTPDKNTLEKILKLLQLEPRDLIRKNEDDYKPSGLNNLSLSDAEVIETLVKFPKLIERPIVLVGEKAVIGRPPENVLEII